MKIPVRNASIALVLQCIFLVVLMYVFNLNIYAVVLSNAFYALCMCFLNEWAVNKYSGAHLDVYRAVILPGISSIGMGLVVFIVYKIIFLILKSVLISVAISIIVGVLVYFALILLLKAVNETELRTFPKGHLLIKLGKNMRLL